MYIINWHTVVEDGEVIYPGYMIHIHAQRFWTQDTGYIWLGFAISTTISKMPSAISCLLPDICPKIYVSRSL